MSGQAVFLCLLSFSMSEISSMSQAKQLSKSKFCEQSVRGAENMCKRQPCPQVAHLDY